MKIKLESYNISTVMGKISMGALPFLSTDEVDEFNKIGYTGKNSDGEKSNYESLLNSLDKGTFTVEQTRTDNGNFTEEFLILRGW